MLLQMPSCAEARTNEHIEIQFMMGLDCFAPALFQLLAELLAFGEAPVHGHLLRKRKVFF
jgi:hypothetical protein